ncbi:hypothetical protein [Wolbachia endosymbiont of Wuchereria bancrofti]|nr:hypothetical protein [Wolbachia endosymbiont of Wuchereria bancrofti]
MICLYRDYVDLGVSEFVMRAAVNVTTEMLSTIPSLSKVKN